MLTVVEQSIDTRSIYLAYGVQLHTRLALEMHDQAGHQILVREGVVQVAHRFLISTTDSYSLSDLPEPARTLELMMLLPTRFARGV